MSYQCPHCSKAPITTHTFRRHLMGTRAHGGHELTEAEANAVIARTPWSDDARTRSAPARPGPVLRRKGAVIRPGHWDSVALLEDVAGVRRTLAAFERAIGHPVYLRPTANGLTVMSLDPATTKMVGVGGPGDCCISAVPPAPDVIEAAAAAYRAKLRTMDPIEKPEEGYVIARIRAALADGLRLREDLAFLHQEWRFPSHDKIDVLAVELETGRVVVIEAKRSEAAARDHRDKRGRTATEQAADYVAQLTAHGAECLSYLQRLVSALARVYRPTSDVRVAPALAPRWEVWWPGGNIVGPSPASEGGHT